MVNIKFCCKIVPVTTNLTLDFDIQTRLMCNLCAGVRERLLRDNGSLHMSLVLYGRLKVLTRKTAICARVTGFSGQRRRRNRLQCLRALAA